MASLMALARASSRSLRSLSWGVSPLHGRGPDMKGLWEGTMEDITEVGGVLGIVEEQVKVAAGRSVLSICQTARGEAGK